MKRISVTAKIKSLLPSCAEKEQAIAQFILHHVRETSYMTIHELADKLGVADSTIFKFAQKMGYKGFRDFRNDLLTEAYDPEVSVHEHITTRDSLATIAATIFHSSVTSLHNTLALLNEDNLKRALNLINNAHTLTFFGCGGSNIVAADAYHKFLRSPLHCQNAIDEHIQIMQASLLTAQDVAIIISHSGLSRTTLQIAEILRENRVPIIFITSYLNTPITRFADVVFISASEETGYRSESLTSRVAQLVILDTLFCAVMFKSDDKNVAQTLHNIRSAINRTKIEE